MVEAPLAEAATLGPICADAAHLALGSASVGAEGGHKVVTLRVDSPCRKAPEDHLCRFLAPTNVLIYDDLIGGATAGNA